MKGGTKNSNGTRKQQVTHHNPNVWQKKFKLKLNRSDKEGHFILINEKVNQEDLTTLKIYESICGVPYFIKDSVLLYLKTQVETNIVRVGYFNSPFFLIGRSSEPVNRETTKWINIIHEIDLADIYRIVYPSSKQYPFYLATHKSFCKTDHILGPHLKSLQIQKDWNNSVYPIWLQHNKN